MPSPEVPDRPLIVSINNATPGTARNNSSVSTLTYFQNFAGGYLVSTSCASFEVGAACGEHDHRGIVEMFYVLSGRGVIVLDGVAHELSTGDCVVVPPGVRHNVHGKSKGSKFRTLCVTVVVPGHEADPTPWKATQD